MRSTDAVDVCEWSDDDTGDPPRPLCQLDVFNALLVFLCSGAHSTADYWWWIPVAGPMVGGVVAAVVYYLLIELHHHRDEPEKPHEEEEEEEDEEDDDSSLKDKYEMITMN